MLERARGFLAGKGTSEPRLDAELVCAHALGLDRLGLFLALDRPLAAPEIARARELLVRRAKGEPVAYLIGEREFYGRPFAVDPSVLVPRPETELVVDRAREIAAERAVASALDVGTGSGCLAVTLALELEGAAVRAVDLSPAALATARRNAERLGADVAFVEGDGPEAGAPDTFDLVVSNPPYVLPAERASLAPEVRDHEPALALFTPDGDPDHWLRRLLTAGVERLAPGGVLLVELGAGQAPRALELAAERGLAARVHDDLAKIPRVLEVARREG